MFNSLASFFHGVVSGIGFEPVEPISASKFIYRDELCKKQPTSKLKGYYGDSFAISKPLLEARKDEKKDLKRSSNPTAGVDAKGTIRVKVKMTKQEAGRLLSKCKDGGVLEFRDVAREIVNLPMDRVSVVPLCAGGSHAVLDSIPEEY